MNRQRAPRITVLSLCLADALAVAAVAVPLPELPGIAGATTPTTSGTRT